MKKISLITMGCAKNTVDSEYLLNLLARAGFSFTGDVRESDIVLINTCGFINTAVNESKDMISEIIDLKKEGLIEKVLVFGCLVQKGREELKREMPEVDGFFGVADHRNIITALGGTYYQSFAEKRTLLGLGHSAYIKISEGCSNRCSFCSIPSIRGDYKSRRTAHIIREAQELTEHGVREINIIGQDTAQYGTDIYGKRSLPKLLHKLSKVKDLRWLRLLYCHPAHVDTEMLETIRDAENICKYIDLPVQHISDNILRSMNRKITTKKLKQVIEKIRKTVPGVIIRTTLITGYPLETEKEFDELCSFVEEFEFDRLGAFKYSPEKGTPAYRLGDPVSDIEKTRRLDTLMRIQQDISLKQNGAMIGKHAEVIIDGVCSFKGTEYFAGRTMNHAPEVDGLVLIKKGKTVIAPGDFRVIKIKKAGDYDLFGEFI